MKIMMKRLKGQIHPLISDNQNGFMPDRGTRNAVFVLKMLLERPLQMQKDIFLCFVDYQAFDGVKHNEAIYLLHYFDIDDKELRTIQDK